MSLLNNCRTLVRLDYDPDQPRDEAGRFGEVGGAVKTTMGRAAKILPRNTTAQQEWHRLSENYQSGVEFSANNLEAMGSYASNVNHLGGAKDKHLAELEHSAHMAATGATWAARQLAEGHPIKAKENLAAAESYLAKHEALTASPKHQAYLRWKAAEAKTPKDYGDPVKNQKARDKYQRAVNKEQDWYRSL